MQDRRPRRTDQRTEILKLIRHADGLLALLLDAEREMEKSVWELPGVRRTLADVARLRRTLEEFKKESRTRMQLSRRDSGTGVMAIQDAFHSAMRDFIENDKDQLLDDEGAQSSQLEIGFPPGLFTLADVLQLLGASGKSGQLRVESSNETIQLHLYEGCLTHALSVGGPEEDRLGAILVQRGVLDADELTELLEASRKSNLKLGRLIRDQKRIPAQAVVDAIHEQLTRLFRRAFHERNARMTFRLERVYAPETPGLDVVGMILKQVVDSEGPIVGPSL